MKLISQSQNRSHDGVNNTGRDESIGNETESTRRIPESLTSTTVESYDAEAEMRRNAEYTKKVCSSLEG